MVSKQHSKADAALFIFVWIMTMTEQLWASRCKPRPGLPSRLGLAATELCNSRHSSLIKKPLSTKFPEGLCHTVSARQIGQDLVELVRRSVGIQYSAHFRVTATDLGFTYQNARYTMVQGLR